MSPTGTWLWRRDGTGILWANPAGCAVLGSETSADLAARRFTPDDAACREVGRLAATLPVHGASQLDRLRAFQSPSMRLRGQPLVCSCGFFRLAGTTGILVTALSPADPVLPLPERLRRLDLRPDHAVAAFGPGGRLLFATTEAGRRLAGISSFHALGAGALMEAAIRDGHAAGPISAGEIAVRRLETGSDPVLLAYFAPHDAASAAVHVESAAAHVETAPRAIDAAPQSPALHANEAPAITAAPADQPRVSRPRRRDARPLRMVWQMDATGRFTVGSNDFTDLAGAATEAALGRRWEEINTKLGLDPEGRIARAAATRRTWSAIDVSWPVSGGGERLAVELYGLPVFNHERAFAGYRGFGVCRDVAGIGRLRAADSEPTERKTAITAAAASPDVSAHVSPSESSVSPPGREAEVPAVEAASVPAPRPNVLRFRGTPLDVMANDGTPPAAGERNAFVELTRQIQDGLQTSGLQTGGPQTGEPAARGTQPASWGRRASEWHPLFDTLADAILLVERNGNIVAGNGAAASLFGRRKDDLPGTSLANLLAPESRAAVASRLNGAVPKGRGAAPDVVILAGGSQFPQATMTIAPTGDPQRTVLALRVKDGAAMPPPNAAAVDKAEALARLSHEARAHLDAILGFCAPMLEERFGPVGNDRYRGCVDNIRKAGTNMLSLLSDSVDLAKLEAGTFPLSRIPVRLNDVVGYCVAQVQAEASEAHVIVRTSLAPELPSVMADLSAVRRMVFNLLFHAIAVTRPGGQVILSSAIDAGGHPILRIRDSGEGLSRKPIAAGSSAPRAADPQLSSLERSLPLASALAAANDAHLRITRGPGEGMLFELIFVASSRAGR